VKEIISKYNLKRIGINQHIGSLFMESSTYLESIKALLTIAENFEELEFIDMCGGFGIPYEKQNGQEPLDIKTLGKDVDGIIYEWTKKHEREIEFKIEPGRYIPAECSVLLGTSHAGAYGYVMSSNYNRLRPAEVLIKENGETKIIRRRDTLEDLMRNYLDI